MGKLQTRQACWAYTARRSRDDRRPPPWSLVQKPHAGHLPAVLMTSGSSPLVVHQQIGATAQTNGRAAALSARPMRITSCSRFSGKAHAPGGAADAEGGVAAHGHLLLQGHIRQILPHFSSSCSYQGIGTSYFRNFRFFFPSRAAPMIPAVAQAGLDDAGAFVPVAGDALLLHQPLQGQQQLLIALVADAAADGQRIRLEDYSPRW